MLFPVTLLPPRHSQTVQKPRNMMKKLSVVSAILGAALLSMAPLSFQFSPSGGGSLALVVNAARAADLEVTPYRRAHRRYYRVAEYVPYCGGPYVGPGWHGGSYWGGPWMDLHCYGLPYWPAE